ncbi:MAG: cyanophycin synthetase, partial [Pseudomonadota bacterium]
GFRDFAGLPHRSQVIGAAGGVTFVNDSKATNADAAEKALLAFDRIRWIAGGQPKAGGIAPLAPLFGRVAKAYLIGEAAAGFAATLGETPHSIAGTLDAALAQAAAEAAPGETVLLSPACASFDQFDSFEARGTAFAALVAALPD